MSEVTTRCIVCDAEFTDEQIKGAKECPKCGSKDPPLDVKLDYTIKINERELRVLTIWAANWSEKCPPESQKVLSAILQRIRQQLPDVPLTIGDEVRQLQNAGYNASLVAEGGKVLIPEKGKPS